MVDFNRKRSRFFLIAILLNLCPLHVYPQSEFQTQLQKAEFYASQRDFLKAAEHLSKALDIDLRDIEARVQLAIACTRMGWIDKAVESYVIALQLDPNDPAAQYGLKVLAHYNMGLSLARKGSFEKAKTQYQRASELDPELSLPHFQVGYLLAQQGKFEEAIPFYQKAIELYPNNTNAYYQLANAYFRMGKQNEGKRQLKTFREIKAKERFYMAEQSLKKGNVDEAATSFQRALDMDAAFAPAYVRLSAIAVQANDLESAEQYLRQALEIKPGFVAAHYQLGWIYQKQREIEKAIEAFEGAVSRRPNFAPACNALAWLYVEQGKNIDAAIQLAQRAVKLKPSAAHWDTLAYALYEKQRYEEAAEAIAQAVAFQPDELEYTERQRLIKKKIAGQNR